LQPPTSASSLSPPKHTLHALLTKYLWKRTVMRSATAVRMICQCKDYLPQFTKYKFVLLFSIFVLILVKRYRAQGF
jgi:hypothetical protein